MRHGRHELIERALVLVWAPRRPGDAGPGSTVDSEPLPKGIRSNDAGRTDRVDRESTPGRIRTRLAPATVDRGKDPAGEAEHNQPARLDEVKSLLEDSVGDRVDRYDFIPKDPSIEVGEVHDVVHQRSTAR